MYFRVVVVKSVMAMFSEKQTESFRKCRGKKGLEKNLGSVEAIYPVLLRI